jgi:hypothetical protein
VWGWGGGGGGVCEGIWRDAGGARAIYLGDVALALERAFTRCELQYSQWEWTHELH